MSYHLETPDERDFTSALEACGDMDPMGIYDQDGRIVGLVFGDRGEVNEALKVGSSAALDVASEPSEASVVGQCIADALVDVKHVGDYGTLWVHPHDRLVHLTMGDSDGAPDPGVPGYADLTTFDVVRSKVTEAVQPFWPGWSAGSSHMGDRDGNMEIADEWDPDPDAGWYKVGTIGTAI